MIHGGVYNADKVIPETLYTQCPCCCALFEVVEIDIAGITQMDVLAGTAKPYGEVLCECPECEASWMFKFGGEDDN